MAFRSGVVAGLFLLSQTFGFSQTPAGPADPVYGELRNATVQESVIAENIVLQRDSGEITLKSGTISFLTPAMGKVTGAVFRGEGEFTLDPALPSEAIFLAGTYGMLEVRESFKEAVFFFTDGTYEELRGAGATRPSTEDDVKTLERLRKRLRSSPKEPRSTVEAQLSGEDIDNVEAEILADLYEESSHGFFSAYIKGDKYQDLRFHVRPRGAVYGINSGEEVALINLDPGNPDEGIWYLAHLSSEYQGGAVDTNEGKWVVDAQSYDISTDIDGGENLAASTTMELQSLRDGLRVLRLGLLPDLRVSSVRFNDQPTTFIQEDVRADGSLYVVLPAPMPKGRSFALTVDYAGKNVISSEGGGNYSVGARTSWYPTVNTFSDQALYHLTFRVPKNYILVSVGDRVREERQDKIMLTEWKSEVPLAVAGFNYGEFKKKDLKIKEINDFELEGLANRDVPDYLKPIQRSIPSLRPSRMIDLAISEADASLRIYSDWFGQLPYRRLAITQQPESNFGQSWPGLVYLPIIAFFDSTQRYMIFDQINGSVNSFIQEVTPHEVAHQWWGHMVGWDSYRDQWLSEGFADFSAGLFLQLTNSSPDRYYKFLSDAQKAILTPNSFGYSPNDVGPLSMGQRLNTARTGRSYQNLIYPKGAYVLHMIRMMMWDPQTGDERFRTMMHDFVETHLHRNASSASFQAVVEKHMPGNMNLTGNGSLDWFFSEWVYGTDVPKYDFKYEVGEDPAGGYVITFDLTQSEVSDNFAMPVPLYVKWKGRTIRAGFVSIQGNKTLSGLKIKVPERPDEVVLNANYDILAR